MYQFDNISWNVSESFAEEDLIGRKLEKAFAAQLVAAGGVLIDIIATRLDGQFYLIDGRKRLLHARWLNSLSQEDFDNYFPAATVEPSDFATISCKLFYDISPQDQATWSIILNDESLRQENLVGGFLAVKQLQAQGKWDEIVDLFNLNKARYNRIMILSELKEPDVWFGAFQEGKVTENVLVSVAKLGGRQDIALDMLRTKGKLTGQDVIAAKKARVASLLASMPSFQSAPARVVAATGPLYAVLSDDLLSAQVGAFQTMFEESRATGKKLYALKEV
jgi:hypothetical protein